MNKYMKIPDVTLYAGLEADRDTVLNFESENGRIKQELKDLKFVQFEKRVGDNFESEIKTTIFLKEGMVVLFEDENRGYVVPANRYVRIGEALEDLEAIKDLDKEE